MKHFFTPHLFLIIFIHITCRLPSFSQTFTEVSRQAGIDHFTFTPTQIGGGAAFFDYDNDEGLDIYVTGGLNRDFLYHNNGDGSFTERGIAAGLGITGDIYTQGVVTGDIDNDGYRDIFVTTYGLTTDVMGVQPNLLFHNNGNGTFINISQAAGITHSARSASATMGDYNLDGFLDIYVANYVAVQGFIRDSFNRIVGYSHTGFTDYLYKNNGNGTFTEVASQLQVDNAGTGLAAAFTDYDNDHDADLYLVNDFGQWVIPNKLYRNEFPADSFSDVSASSGAAAALYGMGVAIGDYDEDGDLDYYITNIGNNVLYRNNGNGTFSDVAVAAGVPNGNIDSMAYTTGWGTAFLDYDNDTWLDLFVADGWIASLDFLPTSEKDPNKLYKNNGNGTFTDVSMMEGVSDSTINRGFATGDYDNDGDLDMLVVALEEDTFFPKGRHTLLYRNDVSNGNHWLKVKVQGTLNNLDGFGTRVEVYSNGRKFIREIDGGSSHESHNSSIAHFGMGSYAKADSIVVIWPGGGMQTLFNISVNQLIKVIEGGQTQLATDVYFEICDGDSLFAGGSYQKSSGTYYDTLTSSGGLDSVLILHLTVHPVTVTHHPVEICDGDSFFYRGSYHYSDTLFYDTLSSATGCDSIIITSLIVFPLPVTIGEALICEGDSFFAGGAWQKQAGTFYDTVPETLCNRVIITSLSVIMPSSPDSVHAFICQGDSIWAGGAYQYSEGYYTDIYRSSTGCDSTVITRVEVIIIQPAALQFNLCQGDTLFFGGEHITQQGSYQHHLVSSSGCDSVVVFLVEVDSGYTISTGWIIPDGDSFFVGGNWQTGPGIYTDTYTAANGCDSIVYTNLQVQVGNRILAPLDVYFSVYPNPANQDFIIGYAIPFSDEVRIEMFTMTGTRILLLNERQSNGQHTLEIERDGILPGVYIVSFKTSRHTRFAKAIIH